MSFLRLLENQNFDAASLFTEGSSLPQLQDDLTAGGINSQNGGMPFTANGILGDSGNSLSLSGSPWGMMTPLGDGGLMLSGSNSGSNSNITYQPLSLSSSSNNNNISFLGKRKYDDAFTASEQQASHLHDHQPASSIDTNLDSRPSEYLPMNMLQWQMPPTSNLKLSQTFFPQQMQSQFLVPQQLDQSMQQQQQQQIIQQQPLVSNGASTSPASSDADFKSHIARLLGGEQIPGDTKRSMSASFNGGNFNANVPSSATSTSGFTLAFENLPDYIFDTATIPVRQLCKANGTLLATSEGVKAEMTGAGVSEDFVDFRDLYFLMAPVSIFEAKFVEVDPLQMDIDGEITFGAELHSKLPAHKILILWIQVWSYSTGKMIAEAASPTITLLHDGLKDTPPQITADVCFFPQKVVIAHLKNCNSKATLSKRHKKGKLKSGSTWCRNPRNCASKGSCSCQAYPSRILKKGIRELKILLERSDAPANVISAASDLYNILAQTADKQTKNILSYNNFLSERIARWKLFMTLKEYCENRSDDVNASAALEGVNNTHKSARDDVAQKFNFVWNLLPNPNTINNNANTNAGIANDSYHSVNHHLINPNSVHINNLNAVSNVNISNVNNNNGYSNNNLVNNTASSPMILQGIHHSTQPSMAR